MAASELTVYIVENSPTLMARLSEAVDEIPNARIVGRAAAVAEAFAGVRQIHPRVLILDVQLTGGSGFQLLKMMRSAGVAKPESIIVVTNYPTDAYRAASRECGADHFFDKGAEFDKLREVLVAML